MALPALAFATCLFLAGQSVAIESQLKVDPARPAPKEHYLQHVLHDYLNNNELAAHMLGYPARCGIGRAFSIGRSVLGAELWALEVSTSPGVDEPKPAFKFVGNMHGDEPTGRVLQLAFAEWLCAKWRTDADARRLVEDMKLFFLPTMNPDGFAARQRGNNASVDLNRDFPDPIEHGHDNLSATGREQPETRAVMRWSQATRFVASASMHEGAFVANYPWDGSEDRGTHYSECPDDAAFRHLARTYAGLHPRMNASHEFEGGITNGAAWYPLWGGMQDWNYLAAGCMELTLELSQNKWPQASDLATVWEDNRAAMVALPLTAAFGGLRGFVREEVPQRVRKSAKGLLSSASSLKAQGQPLRADISVEGIEHNVTSSVAFGDFYRPLAPGEYLVTASAAGYAPNTARVHVPADGSGAVHDFALESGPSSREASARAEEGSWPKLPRKFGASDGHVGDASASQPQPADEKLLLSEGLWIKMMQTALIFFLGCSVGLLGVSALVSLRLVSISRSAIPGPLRLLLGR